MKYRLVTWAFLGAVGSAVLVDVGTSLSVARRSFSFSMRTDSTHLRIITSPEDGAIIPYPYGERALQGAGMAKNIRSLRTARGRLVADQESSKSIPAITQAQQVVQGCTATTTIATATGSSSSSSYDAAVVRAATTTRNLSLSYTSALQVLTAYHVQHNDLVLPRRFLVPATDDYPKEWHGVDLPATVYTMRWWQLHVRQHTDRVAELNALGFVWERLQPEWNLILEALITYSALYGDVMVPVSFVVPHGDVDFPKATWGIALGKCVYRMRLRHDFLKGPKGATRRSQLNQLCFIWDVKEYVFEKFCATLVHYAKMQQQQQQYNGALFEKSLKIPSTFCVPSDSSWPRGLWGYPLGAKCTAVRQKGLYVKGDAQRQARLEQIGFSWKGNASRGWYEVVHAAAIYSQIHNRVLDVPSHYRVPGPPELQSEAFYVGHNDASWPWPEHLWDFPLGQRLKDVRLKGAYLKGSDGPKRRAQLDALGFVWNPKRGRR